MPARGRTRISSTGSERNGESAMRASSTTVPLTLRSRLNILFIRRFLAVFWLSAVSCALWGVEGACRIIVCDQAGRCDREALCPILRWVAGACCLRRRWSCLRRCRGSGRRARAWRPRARSISGPGGFPGLVRSHRWRFPARRCVPRPLPVPCAVGGRARTGRRRAGSPICRSGVPGAS